MTCSRHWGGRVAYHDNIGLSLSSVSQIDRKNGTLIWIGSRLEFSKTVQVLAIRWIDSDVDNFWNEARHTELGHPKVLLEDRLFHYEATLAH